MCNQWLLKSKSLNFLYSSIMLCYTLGHSEEWGKDRPMSNNKRLNTMIGGYNGSRKQEHLNGLKEIKMEGSVKTFR